MTADGLFVIACYGNRSLQVHEPNGMLIRRIGSEVVRNPHNPICLASGMIAVADCGDNDGELSGLPRRWPVS